MPQDLPNPAGAAAAIDDNRIAPEKWLVLGAIFLAAVMMPLSAIAPVVALPAIGAELGGGAFAINWIVNGAFLAFGSAVMAAGALADLFGRKRLFTLGLCTYSLLSLVVAASPTILVLDVARTLQAAAAALAMIAGFAALAQEFEGAARTRAFSILGTGFGIGIAFGPIIGGALVGSLGWRAIFVMAAVLSLGVLLVSAPRLRESRDPDARRFDAWGVVTFTLTLALLTLGIMQGPQSGWDSLPVLALFAGFGVMLAVFLAVERAQVRPMLDVTLFTYPRFLAVLSLPVAVAYSFIVVLFVLPARLVGVEGMLAAEVGLLMLPLSGPITIIPFLGALLTKWVPPGLLSGMGLIIGAGGLVLLALVEPGAGALAFVLPLLMIGVGAAIPWGLMDDLAVSVVPTERAGMAVGIFATARVAGESIAIAVTGAILLGFTQAGLRDAAPGALSPEAVVAAANGMVGGRIAEAALAAPALDGSVLTRLYGNAFSAAMLVLALITFAAALAAIGFVRRHEVKGMEPPPVTESKLALCEAESL
ncbi:MFS transporter [Oleomonas cavernae]|uniref:MFS transporter n=1 Tax=Oleomonas cavernae TaxID=2320859 RepID=A0A418WGY3_9PROT|nr:MFS transporter [Oleomonas cavernae]RJF89293.1 MFS transporter [Oleomonas cavernae]